MRVSTTNNPADFANAFRGLAGNHTAIDIAVKKQRRERRTTYLRAARAEPVGTSLRKSYLEIAINQK